jgi:hypothetical protein
MLKALASVFKQEFKQHTYGAFGIPNERDIATALHASELMFTKLGSDQIQAVAIFKILKSASAHEDFSGRQCQIKAGDVLVRYIAGTYAGMEKLIQSLIEKCPGRALWVECHQEISAIKLLLQSNNFSQIMVKISASSDIKGLYLRGDHSGRLPKGMETADVPSMKQLCAEFITADQRDRFITDLRNYEATKPWAQHYSSYNKRQSWTAFALHGYDQQDPSFIIKPSEMSRKWKEENPARLQLKCGPTPASVAMSETWVEVQKIIPCRFQRVRLMRLSSKGGELTRHADITDPEAGTRDGQIARLHIPLQTNPGCEFRSWDMDGREHRIHFAERGLYYLDTRKPHAVQNKSDADRIHLVCDVYSNSWVRELING